MSQIDIDKMKLKELKAECKKRGLPVSGNKSVLIARLKAGKSAIKRKASRKPRKRKSAKRKASRKRKSAKRKASRKRKSAKKAAKKSRKRKSAKRKASKKVAKRKPSTKKSRTQDWAAMTKAEISKELKSMKVTEIRKSPKLKPFLKGKSKAKKQELVDHLTDVLSSGQAPPMPKAKRKSAKKQSRKAIKKSAKKKAPKKSARKASTKVSRKASKKAGKSWNIKLTKKFTRESVKKNKDKLFVFGENDECFSVGEKWRKDEEIDEDDECYQLSTQAQIRGEPNAAPIVTISRKGASDKELKSMMKRDVEAILKEMKSGKYKDLVLSSQLVGTGVAQLPKKKPEVWKFLQEQLARLKSGGVLPRPPLGSDKSSINVFTGWLLDKEIRKKPQKVIPRKSRKSVAKPTKPKASTKVITPVPQDSNADIEKAIRKCLYGDSDILPTDTPKEAEPEIVDDDDEEEEELEIVDDE